MNNEILIDLTEEKHLRAELEKRTDAEALRMKRFLDMPDLSRTEGSPLKEIIDRTLTVKGLEGFDIIKIPEIVPAYITFDLFNMPPGHPARSTSDTYYVNEENILRTHDTVMWYYYLNHPDVKAKIANKESLGVICYGKVYRKDEIDRRHMNVFHQFGGLYLIPDSTGTITGDDLKSVLIEIAQNIFGKDVKYRFNEDNFPYTDPSFEMEIEINRGWVEMLGCGLPRKSVLENFGLTGYNGWAFGFGLERLAIVGMELPDIRLLWSTDERVKKQLKLGAKFKEVSKYPEVVRDISFIVPSTFVPNNYFDLIRDIVGGFDLSTRLRTGKLTAGDIFAEEVSLLDKYENVEKFGEGKVSYAYHIVYRSNDRTLTSEEVDALHHALEQKTVTEFGAIIR